MYRRFERVRTVDTAALRTYTIYVMAVLFCMTYVCVCTFSTSYTPRKSKIARFMRRYAMRYARRSRRVPSVRRAVKAVKEGAP